MASGDFLLQMADPAVEGDKLGLVGLDGLEARCQDWNSRVQVQQFLMSIRESLSNVGHE